MLQTQPMVSCLMVTNDRFDLVRRAVASFQNQSYENRELVILGEGDEKMWNYINALNDPKVTYHKAPRPKMILGELRNVSLDLAKGEYVMQWDDDDWCHPARITLQMETLQRSDADICVMMRQTQVWQDRDLYAYSGWWLWENTYLAKKNLMQPYPVESRSEDTQQLRATLQAGAKLCTLNTPELYIYTFHGNNTWNQAHFERMFSQATLHLPSDKKQRILTALSLE